MALSTALSWLSSSSRRDDELFFLLPAAAADAAAVAAAALSRDSLLDRDGGDSARKQPHHVHLE